MSSTRFWRFACGLAMVAAIGACTKSEAPAAPSAPAATPAAAATPTPAAAPVDLSALPAPWNTADFSAGERIFKIKCAIACHSIKPADGHKTGPNLHGVFTRQAGSAEGFKYSDAMIAHAKFVWSPEELDKWLSNPQTYLPKSGMMFPGLKDENDRKNVIAYLLVESGK